MLILWVAAPLMLHAFVSLPSQSPLVIPKQIAARPEPGKAMFRPHTAVPVAAWNDIAKAKTPAPAATIQRNAKWKQLIGLRREIRKAKKNMRDMEDYERSALGWGIAAFIAAIFFIILGGLLESGIVFGALLAIPFGIIAIINHSKARKMGSKRWGGLFLAIFGMVIVTVISALVWILAG